MDALKEMTALNASVGAEAGQPFTKSNTTIINDNDSDFNRFDEINDLCDIDESYLHTSNTCPSLITKSRNEPKR